MFKSVNGIRITWGNKRIPMLLAVSLLPALLSACGGSDGSGSVSTAEVQTASSSSSSASNPGSSSNTSSDGTSNSGSSSSTSSSNTTGGGSTSSNNSGGTSSTNGSSGSSTGSGSTSNAGSGNSSGGGAGATTPATQPTVPDSAAVTAAKQSLAETVGKLANTAKEARALANSIIWIKSQATEAVEPYPVVKNYPPFIYLNAYATQANASATEAETQRTRAEQEQEKVKGSQDLAAIQAALASVQDAEKKAAAAYAIIQSNYWLHNSYIASVLVGNAIEVAKTGKSSPDPKNPNANKDSPAPAIPANAERVDGRYIKLDNQGNPLPAASTNYTCVKDVMTGLTWEIKTDDGGLRDKDWRYKHMKNSAGYYPYNFDQYSGAQLCQGIGSCDAYNYTNVVKSAGLCGRKGWRLPTQGELMTLLQANSDGKLPNINLKVFPETIFAPYKGAYCAENLNRPEDCGYAPGTPVTTNPDGRIECNYVGIDFSISNANNLYYSSGAPMRYYGEVNGDGLPYYPHGNWLCHVRLVHDN